MEDGLKELGVVGYFISAMGTAIVGLSGAVTVQWRHANKVYGYRLQERDVLNKALTDTGASNLVLAEAIRERNSVTAALADSVHNLSVTNTMLHERIGLLIEVHSRDSSSQIDVIKSLAEAIRTNSSITAEAKNSSNSVLGDLTELKSLVLSRRTR